MRIPEVVADSLEKVGGLEKISQSIPEPRHMTTLTTIFQSLSDPVRLSILHVLSSTPLCVCVIKSLVKITDSKLSYHLDNLKSAGLVAQQSEGKFIIYKTTDLGGKLLSASDSIQRSSLQSALVPLHENRRRKKRT